MRYFNKIATACCTVALGMAAITGCEEDGIYEVNAPDWISQKVDSIAAAKEQNQGEEIVLEGMMEDVYTIGNTDYSSGFWTAFTKYYVIPDGETWNAVFNLHINPSATNTYKNFGLVITTDADRGGNGYLEYGVIRYDHQPSGNSEWGDYINRDAVSSTLTFGSDTDSGIDKLGGKVTLTVDRSDPEAFTVTMTNGTVTKTYKQTTALANLNADATNTNIRCFLVVEGSYIDFQETNIEPIGGCTSALDKNPLSMVLQGVPAYVNLGTSLDTAMVGVTALVTFEEGVTATVTAEDLVFSSIPSMDEAGAKTLVAVYNKTFKGENCDEPIMASASFEVIEAVVALEVVTQPTTTAYSGGYAIAGGVPYIAFDPTGMEVKATYSSGKEGIIDNSLLTFSFNDPISEGTQKVTITAESGVTTEVEITVSDLTVATAVTNSASTLGAEDNTSGWWTVFSDDFNVPSGETKSITFTNYSSMAGNWNNFVVILRKADKAEYAVVRADNHGWGAGYDGNENLILSGGQPDWAAWLSDMDGSKVTVYVTNHGDGTADVRAAMRGVSGKTYFQHYLGISTVDPADLNFALTVDGSHIVF